MFNSKDFIADINSDRCSVEEFKSLAIEFCEVLKLCGVEKKPFNPSQKLYFQKRSLKEQKKIIAYLDLNIALFRDCYMSGESTSDDKIILWKLFKRLKSAPLDDFFDKIGDDDLIEVFFTDHTPIFMNLKFYLEFSYSVDEALCARWFENSRRSLVLTLKILRFTINYKKNNNHHETVRWNLPAHHIDEIGSEKELRFWIHLKYLSATHQNGMISAGICTSSLKAIGAHKKNW